MHDPALDVLLNELRAETAASGITLFVADEQSLDSVATLAGIPGCLIISNRVDVVRAAQAAGLDAQFSDFDFSGLADGSVSRIVYRLSKEKPVVHHVINEAARLLAAGGELLFTGYKNEGTKTYFEKARVLFGHGEWQKNSTVYLARHQKQAQPVNAVLLDDQNYAALRLLEADDQAFVSKPGVFGWNKIDNGSYFLADHLPDFLTLFETPPQSLLDLGCGYGYLTVQTRDLPLVRRVATDNNAAAVMAMAKTAEHYGLHVEVVADDCASTLKERFDIILCNPPFHQGFRVDDRLTQKFLQQTQRLLTPGGAALFVVNAFIPLEKAAQSFFRQVRTLASNGSFNLVVLQQPGVQPTPQKKSAKSRPFHKALVVRHHVAFP